MKSNVKIYVLDVTDKEEARKEHDFMAKGTGYKNDGWNSHSCPFLLLVPYKQNGRSDSRPNRYVAEDNGLFFATDRRFILAYICKISVAIYQSILPVT